MEPVRAQPSPPPVGTSKTLARYQGVPLLGILPEVQANPLDFFVRASRLGEAVDMPLPGAKAVFFNTPAAAEHILVTHVKNFVKDTRGYQVLRRLLGNGLLTSAGSFWLRQRRLMQPSFHRERLQRFGDVMVRAGRECVDGWAAHLARGDVFDVHHEMMAVTMRVVAETLMSTDVSRSSEQVSEALTTALEQMVYLTTHPFALPEWIPTPFNRTFRKSRTALDEVVLGIIASRRQRTAPATPDLLQMLLEVKDADTGEQMSDEQLKDEVMTLFLAGHETTANTLSWTFVLLSQNPDVEQRLRDELGAVLQGREPTPADVPRLSLHANVIRESLRLYPPVWSLGRKCLEDDVVDGYPVQKDTLVFVAPYTLHRRPDIFRAPERFLPDRWTTPEGEEARLPKCAYLPFSSGPRKCIGDSFAMMEAILLLAIILQRVRLALPAGQTVEPEPVITLRPRGGVPVTARPA